MIFKYFEMNILASFYTTTTCHTPQKTVSLRFTNNIFFILQNLFKELT